jgi:RNA recognition motif-containing protein
VNIYIGNLSFDTTEDQLRQALAAISGMNGQDMNGRTLNVNEAKPRTDSGNRGGGRGGSNRGGGGYNRY